MRTFRLLSTTSAAAMALATPSLADVTGPDVWATYTTLYESTGAQVFGEVTTTGAETVVVNPALLYRFPFGIATLRMSIPEIRLTDQSDGTVTFAYPDTFDLTVEVNVPDQGFGTGVFSVSQTGFASIISGDPGAINVTYQVDQAAFALKDLSISTEEFDVQGQVIIDGYSGSSDIFVGEDLVTVTGTQTVGKADLALAMTGLTGEVVTVTGENDPSSYVSEMALPVGGKSLFALSEALRDGAKLSVQSEVGANTLNTVATQDGQTIYQEERVNGPTTTDLSIDATGFRVTAEAGESSFRVFGSDDIPFPLAGAVSGASVDVGFPLLPSEDPQEVILQLGMNDFTLDEEIWSLFDPAGELPRDPASFNLDIVANVISDIDWLDFSTLEDQLDQPIPPITPEQITINDLSLSAVGASAEGNAALTLDLTDMETFDGFPRPEGEAYLAVTGANGLIDRLTNMGLIGPEEAGMARLGMGFIARSTGSDSFETAVEVNEAGEVYVNGQRMR